LRLTWHEIDEFKAKVRIGKASVVATLEFVTHLYLPDMDIKNAQKKLGP